MSLRYRIAASPKPPELAMSLPGPTARPTLSVRVAQGAGAHRAVIDVPGRGPGGDPDGEVVEPGGRLCAAWIESEPELGATARMGGSVYGLGH